MATTKMEPLADWVQQEVDDPAALQFLRIVYNAIEVWDDIIDKDGNISDEDVHAAFTALLIELPFNRFFEAQKAALCPAIATVITSWHASNQMPRSGAAGAQGYTLRKEFINLVVMVVGITRGMAAARQAAVRGWTDSANADSFDDYLKGR